METIAEYKAANRVPDKMILVKIADKIAPPNECQGFLVHQRHIDARKAGALGFYKGYVPGAGGDLWWIQHDDDTIGAYMHNEVFDR